jgi:actin-like ATPase involved in cell morphogenesis
MTEEAQPKEEVAAEPKSKKKVDEFKPGAGVDVGTSNIVVSRQKKDGTFVNRYHRNMLYPLAVSDESSDLLDRSDYLYVKVDDKYYVVGEDALRLVNAIGQGEVVRPMKDGILNPSLKESSELLFYIIKAVVGEPIIENEPLRYSIPANPVDSDLDNLFHKIVLEDFFKRIGYAPKAVNEAMCICYDCNPVMTEDDGNKIPLTGIACSAGGGMWNIALSFKGVSVVEFSCTKSGDNLDEQVARVTGISKNKVIKIKEKKLDLDNVDQTDRVQTALAIYYDEMMNRMLHHITENFKDKQSEMDGEVEIVVAGGTSMAPGFCAKFAKAAKETGLPFNVTSIRHSKTPFYSVSQGACIRAQADHSKNTKK